MKILVVSDSHRDSELLHNLVKKYPDMDYYLHAGDSCDFSYSIAPFDSVKGNCDYYDYDEKRFLRTPYGNILMRHYPTLSRDEAKDIKIFIYGYTHEYDISNRDGIIWLNPGSVSLPRDGSNGTYAIIKLEKEQISIDIIDIITKNVLLHYLIS